MIIRISILIALSLIPAFSLSQETQETQETLETQESQPRVLILGDNIYQQPASVISKELKGVAIVKFVKIEPGEIRNTTSVLENFDQLIGEEKWDLIHFNLGLGDLVHRAPNMKSFRVLPPKSGGVRATSPELYRSNLDKIVVKLKSTNAKLIWASTTPIRSSTTKVFDKSSEVEYNTIAEQVMTTNEIPINDMYTHVKEVIDMNRPASHGADPFNTDKKPIHSPIVEAIKRSLEIK